MTKPDRMLVAAPERWDEACFAVPAVRALVGAGWAVGVLCERDRVDFWQKLDGVKVMSCEDPLDAADWDAAVAWETGHAAKRVASAGIPRRIAPAGGDKKLAKWATHPVRPRGHVLDHRVRHFLSTVEELGLETKQRDYFAAVDFGVPRVAGTAMLCPDSDFGASHEWPLDQWAELAGLLQEKHDVRLTVATGRGGRRLGESLADRLGNGAKSRDVSDLAASLAVFPEHALVIAADSSLPHLAGFAGATCVVLFGPNDAAWRRPLGRHHAIVREHVECAPCLLAKCPLDMRCQNRLTVARVAAAATQILNAHPVA